MYPVCLHIEGQLCVVLGGGAVARRKIQGLLKARARVCMISPDCDPVLQNMVAQGLLEWRQKKYETTDLEGARLVFAATSKPDVQQKILQDARKAGILINIADDPKSCDFHLPASVRRGDLLLCVSTGGRSPALAAQIRQRLDADFGSEYLLLTELLGRVRDCALQKQWCKKKKDHTFAALLHADVLCWLKTGQNNKVRQRVYDLLGTETPLVDLDFLGTEKS